MHFFQRCKLIHMGLWLKILVHEHENVTLTQQFICVVVPKFHMSIA